MKKDPYKHKERWETWISKVEDNGIDGLNKINSALVIKFMRDMEMGINISKISKKGGRSYIRLNHLQQKIIFIIKLLEKKKIKDIGKVKSEELHKLFNDMRTGTIKKKDGGIYKSSGDYVKQFKAFWHWYQKIEKKKGKLIEDICEDLDTRGEKPKFIYFEKDIFERIINKVSYDLKPILALAFDSGMRVTELANIKVSDFLNDYHEVNIREETSKTFGRRIKLMLCSKQTREYVNKLGLTQKDFFCQKSPTMINKELKKIGKEVLSPRQLEFKNLSLIDFRHSSACYWLPKYKSESALKYRFGWKKSDMIHYYTELLGMKDTITQDDMFEDITKAELEKEMESLKKELGKFRPILEMVESATRKKQVMKILNKR
ncbi:hypothetical protein ES703_53649 [subsurface metagenome]